MIKELFGCGDSAKLYAEAVGKKIESVALVDDALRFVFTDGTKIRVRDDGQSCCEHRYMTTDYTLSEFSGADFLGIEIKDAPCVEDECGECHDVQFLEVKTSIGEFVMSSHNEHNGYYGGFDIVVEEVE
jgi:hypothetical protein